MSARRERLAFVLLVLPLVVFLLFMVMVPFVIAVLSSVGLTQVAPGLPDGFTLRGYRDFFDPEKPNLQALWFTIKITFISTVLATVLGYGLVLFVKFRRIRLGQTLSLLVKLPLFTPYLVTAFMWWALLFPRGYIGIFVQKVLIEYFRLAEEAPALISDPYGIGIVACSVWMRFPVVFLIMQSLMEMVNPSYEEAARNLGARTPTIIRRIYFPLTIYGLLSSVTLNFLALFIAFSIPFILGASWPQFLSVFIYVNAKDKGDWLMGYTTSVIYIAISLVISYVYTRSLARRTAHV
ncbi:MAG: ABC transporter permease subunit [Candidatus Rokubacteria bacterium]|nr:ABC transporter permease subunit [Candidatus Rokubacteria bacterium]